MKSCNWNNFISNFHSYSSLRDIFWDRYSVRQLRHDVETRREIFTTDDEFISCLHEYFYDEIVQLCRKVPVPRPSKEKPPSPKARRKAELGLALQITAQRFYDEYADLFAQHPKKLIGDLISYLPAWVLKNYDWMEPGRYKKLTDCLCANYSGADLIAWHRPPNNRRQDNFIQDAVAAQVFYSHYKTEFKRYATQNHIEIPGPGAEGHAWINFTNLVFAQTLTGLYTRHRKALTKFPTVSLSAAIKMHAKTQER